MVDERARHLRQSMTPQEIKVWSQLRLLRPQGLHFRRQAPLRGYILDFVCFSRKLIVEVDGSQHGDGAQVGHDGRRDALFAAEGFLTLRFWNAEVDSGLNGVIETIFARAMERAPTRPHPTRPPDGGHPPHKGEG